MVNSSITEQQAKIFFESLDSKNNEEAEYAFKKVKDYLDANNLKFSDWIKETGDLNDLTVKFTAASDKNRRLKRIMRKVEGQYSNMKSELKNI